MSDLLGAEVVLQSLVARADLNGQWGTVLDHVRSHSVSRREKHSIYSLGSVGFSLVYFLAGRRHPRGALAPADVCGGAATAALGTTERRDPLAADPARCFDFPIDPAPAGQ